MNVLCTFFQFWDLYTVYTNGLINFYSLDGDFTRTTYTNDLENFTTENKKSTKTWHWWICDSKTSNNTMVYENSDYFSNKMYVEIYHPIDVVRIQTREITEDIRKFNNKKELFMMELFRSQIIDCKIAQIQNHVDHHTQDDVLLLDKLKHMKSALSSVLEEKAKSMVAYQFHIVEKLRFQYLIEKFLIKRFIYEELIWWKRYQQLASIGAKIDTGHLDIIQASCECLAEETWTNWIQTNEMITLCEAVGETPEILHTLYDFKVKFDQLSAQITSTFVIERQPPQVMKTNTRFSAKIRLLVGGSLNVYMSPPQVKVSIFSEAQLNHLLCGEFTKGDSSGEILNNIGTMRYEQSTKQLSITFRNMKLKKIIQAKKKASESIVNEKFSFLFSTNFSIGSHLECHVETLSLPVIVIDHCNQEPHAWATIVWDNAFAEPDRKAFEVPEKVSWDKFSMVLNMEFFKITGKSLSKDNLNYLAEKLFGTFSDNYDTWQISRSQFCEESLPNHRFTFWDWFYAVMKLIRRHLKPLWMDGIIHGFVRERQAEEMLYSCPRGTFLLKFSDSELGGINVVRVAGRGGKPMIKIMRPFTAEDFATQKLADRLNDLKHLVYFYPGILKENAFGKYYTPITIRKLKKKRRKKLMRRGS